MPIGKNAIKRISNDGYSNVKTSAPDMENSTVDTEQEKINKEKKVEASVETPKKDAEKKTAPKKSATTKKSTKAEPKAEPKSDAKAAPKKSMETEPSFSPVNTAEKIIDKKDESAEQNERQGDGYVNLGGKMPIHLL